MKITFGISCKKTCISIIYATILIFFIPDFLDNASADTVVSSNVGILKVDNATISISPYESKIVKIYGNVTDSGRRDEIIISYTYPDGSKNGNKIYSTRHGYFETILMLDDKSPKGVYEVLALHKTKLIGSISFSLIENGTSVAEQLIDDTKPIEESVASIDSDTIWNEFCLGGPQSLNVVVDEVKNNTSITLQCVQQERTFTVTIIDKKLEKILVSANIGDSLINTFSKKLNNKTSSATENVLALQIDDKAVKLNNLQPLGPLISLENEFDVMQGLGLRPL